MPARSYDVVVVGAGPAGENAADYARQRGLTTVVVERELVGGECAYWACMPSKALLRPGEALAAARHVPGAAAAVTGHLDVDAVLAGRDAFASGWDDRGQVDWLASAGIDLVRGHARLAGERVVEVTGDDGTTTRLTATRGVVLAVGSRAAVPPIDGLADVDAWTSREVTATRTVPRRLLVLGGGVVGVEMAQAMRRLGADEVTIVQSGPRLLDREEPFVGDQLRTAFEDEGIDVEVDARAVAAHRDHGGTVQLELADGRTLDADELLVAVGRVAPTGDLGLDTIGVQPGPKGHLDVDEHLRVPGHDWLYVVGDANGRALLTHQGKYQGRLVGDALAGVEVEPAWADLRAVPRVVFTDPQVAAVGPTATEARDAGHDVLVVTHELGAVAGTSLHGTGPAGTAQLVVDRDRRVVLGATLVGPGVGELLHAATVAVVGEVPLDRLWHAVPAFPTVSEIWLRLLEEVRHHDLGRGDRP